MYSMEECVSFRTLRIGYELQGARNQIQRALESARSVAGVCPEDSLERALGAYRKCRAAFVRSAERISEQW